LDIRQLRYFMASIQLGSLKEAARQHFVTQPAISIQLKKLEEEVGEKLYIRRGRRIEATQAGGYVLRHAEAVLRTIEALEDSIRGLKELKHGTLRLGNIDAASIYVLPAVFRSFHRKHPGVDIQVVVADSDSLVQALDAGGIELAILTLPLRGDQLVVDPIYDDHMVLVCGPRHPLVVSRIYRRNPLKSVAEGGLITYPAHSTTRRLIEQVFLENGLTVRASMEMSSPEAIKRLTEAGLGASILPLRVVSRELKRGTLKSVSTGKVRFKRTLGVAYRNGDRLSPPSKAFLRMLHEKFRIKSTVKGHDE
jgi:DNA-binding transcriptional LysR family regulator